MASHADFASAIPDVLGRYGYWPYGEPVPVSGGTLNWNYRVESDGGSHFVRRYRDDLETPRILGEHELVQWAAERGVPVPLPEQTPDDESLVNIAGGRWALFLWIEGEVRPRGTLTPPQVRTLGALHGFTQSALAGHPTADNERPRLTWDKDQSLQLLATIQAAAAEQGAEQWVQQGIAKQLAMLQALDVLPPAAFASLPTQVLHGDFHDQQVIWQGDQVAALVDWEIWHTGPRAWELVRSLSFSKLLDSPGLEDYLAGYREFIQLSDDECRLALRLWWQSRVVGVWALSAHFLRGNARVKDFFPEMIAELDRISDESWKRAIEERFVRAAV